MRLIKNSLLILVLLISSSLYCQNVSYYKIGEEELANLHIYSIKQLSNGELYITTDRGLYEYVNGEFSQIPWRDLHKGNSLFSLRTNSENELFCSNLSGQIFKLNQDSIELFLETPSEYLNSSFDFTFDDEDRVIIQSKIYALYDAEWSVLYNPMVKPATPMNSYSPSQILVSGNDNGEIISFENGTVIQAHQEDLRASNSENLTFSAKLGNDWIKLNSLGLIQNITSNKSIQLNQNSAWNINQMDNSEIWMRSAKSGVIQVSGDSLAVNGPYFQNQFISWVEKGNSETYFFGTFGDGIIVVPNFNSRYYLSSGAEIEGLCEIPTEYKLQNCLISVPNGRSKIIATNSPAFYLPDFPYTLSSKAPKLLQSTSENLPSISSIKDVVTIDSKTSLLASTNGLFLIGKPITHLPHLTQLSDSNWYSIDGIDRRVNQVEFEPISGFVYFATTDGLYSIDSVASTSEIRIGDSTIICNSMCLWDTITICGTQDHGVIFLENGKITNRLSSKSGLIDKHVEKVLFYENQLYIAQKTTFQIFDLQRQSWKQIGRIHGSENGFASEFIICNDSLWLANGKRLEVIPLSSINREPQIEFILSEISLGHAKFKEGKSLIADHADANLKCNFKLIGVELDKNARVEYLLNQGKWVPIHINDGGFSLTSLAPGDYQINLRLNNLGIISNEKEISFTISPPFWQTWWFILTVIIGTSIIAFVVFQIRLIKSKQIQSKRLEEQKLRADYLESELKAVRAQMNPHFIFNALNSIQDLIIKEDTQASYDYIVKFAKLVRKTLTYSNFNFIPFEEEIDFLKTYLTLEQLRFNEDFEFNIQFDFNTDIEIPSLIIQPFVENAIVHGLMHKKGAKTLNLLFELSEQTLYCQIDDNGVGRKQAQIIANRQSKKHNSFAMSAIEQRIALLNKKNIAHPASFIVEDRLKQNQVVGTRVKLILPFIA